MIAGRRCCLAMLYLLVMGILPAHAAEFLVGSELPLTGAFARVGNDVGQGISVAAEVFNKRNGKHQVKVVTVDDESSPAKAVAAVEKLASQGVVAIVGGYGTNLVGPASDAANRAKLVYITGTGLGTSLTERGYQTFFRTTNIASYGRAVLGLIDDLGLKSLSVLYSTREPPTDLVKMIEAATRAKGIKLTLHSFDPALTDFKPILNKVKLQDKPDGIVLLGYENDYVNILRGAKLIKPDVKAVIASWSFATGKMVKEYGELMQHAYGNVNRSYPSAFNTPDEKDFADTYRRLFKSEPSYQAELGYVQAQVLFDAIARAHEKGNLQKGGLADELRKTDMQTIQGRVKFDDKGDNSFGTTRMGQVVKEGIVTVWPKDAADAKPAFPAVPWQDRQ